MIENEPAEQQRIKRGAKLARFGRHPEAGFSTQVCVWIEKDGELYLGGGRVMLLERVEKLGSIAAAARSMNLTYSNAWMWLDAMNRLAPSPLVNRVSGGVKGGGSKITAEGRRAIEQFHTLRDRAEALVHRNTGHAGDLRAEKKTSLD